MSPVSRLDGGLAVFCDELGQSASVMVDTKLYDKAAIFKSAYWATERAYLFLSKEIENDNIRVEFRVKTGETDLRQIVREFCNALIDQQTRQIVLRETANERDILLGMAFSAGYARLNPDTLNHENLPHD
ncbi:MAG: His-Xaa-Ser system protein HxsD [Zoogloeaceae bacterium]|jgi:His-Xaa-Ser system protein HxsD|nr:His-Xaa-Ser system protein HxsD [Zoogloeaceae bacterium]